MQAATYILLGLSILAVWLPSVRPGSRAVPLWPILYGLAVITAIAAGVLEWIAMLSIGPLAAVSIVASTAERVGVRRSAAALAVCLALAMALHLLPGFNNPKLYDAVRFSEDAAPFTNYLNFDKGTAGLFLVATFCRRVERGDSARTLFRNALIATVATTAVVMTLAYLSAIVGWAPKLPPLWVAFLAVNLLFTCIAEEAFFRGFLQERIAQLNGGSRAVSLFAVIMSAMLFGVAHLGGGLLQAALAGIAGLGYAGIYQWTRRIEAPIAAHFGLNATHFLVFTYPYIAR